MKKAIYLLLFALAYSEPGLHAKALNQVEHSYQDFKPGDKAPDFADLAIVDQDGNARSLADFKGKKLVLYFYPKSNTPGCNAEAASFRDASGGYKRNNIEVVGVSYDDPKTQKKYKYDHNLPFTLLSDTKKELAKRYGTYQNNIPEVPARVTFLIDENGSIVKVLDNITVRNHAQEVLDAWGITDKVPY